jgi:hypothetical protein
LIYGGLRMGDRDIDTDRIINVTWAMLHSYERS